MNKIEFPKFKDYDGQPVRYIQPKADGHLVKVYKNAVGFIYAETKNSKDVSRKVCDIKHIKKELMGLPNDSQIFAELHCPGRFSTDVKTMLNESNEDLRLTAFAAPMLGGVDYSGADLLQVMKTLDFWGFESTNTGRTLSDKIRLFPSNTFTPASLDKKWQDELIAYAIEQKLEGWVLKESHMSGWYKLKPEKELDAFVTSTNMSTSASYYGLLKSVQAAVWEIDKDGNRKLYDIGTVPGFSEAEREKYDTPEKRKTLIGRVLKIGHSGLAARGKLRWPHFDHWREDKDADQCTTQQFE